VIKGSLSTPRGERLVLEGDEVWARCDRSKHGASVPCPPAIRKRARATAQRKPLS
jgi:hypothetical protein